MSEQQQSKPWYKEPWPWILMSGPALVVVAAFITLSIAHDSMGDLVSDDYYKDGKHIDLNLQRDQEAVKRQVKAQIVLNPEHSAVKVFLEGNVDFNVPVRLLFLHPAKQANDLKVDLKAVTQGENGKAEYTATFPALSDARHWYVRVEDANGVWRVEDKWLVRNGDMMELRPLGRLLDGRDKPK